MQRGKMVIYGCGGAGVNATLPYHNVDAEPGQAEIRTGFVDTSRSNLRDGINDDDIFILEDVDGSGKIRSENHQQISGIIKQVLVKIEPGDFNVVVFSASGGSGSVIGPLLMGELLSRGINVVCVVIGSDESIITCENTLKTLKSLEGQARKHNVPVLMYYEHNNRKRSEVDAAIRLVIGSLAVLSSRRNRAFDTADLTNWVYFNKATVVKPQLAMFDVYGSNEQVDKEKDPIALISLYRDEDDEHSSLVPEYSATGYFTEEINGLELLHYVVTTHRIPAIHKEIQARLTKYLGNRDSRVETERMLSENDSVTDDGLVL